MMNYCMKSGVLYSAEDHTVKARIKSAFSNPDSLISLPGSEGTYKATVFSSLPQSEDVRNYTYVMTDPLDHTLLKASPDYAPGALDTAAPAPLHRIPRVDHAAVSMNGESFELKMHDSTHYSLQNALAHPVMELNHRGVTGGWNITAENTLSPAILCGLYIFCRYIEQENEFYVV